jgi:hypothetical protein
MENEKINPAVALYAALATWAQKEADLAELQHDSEMFERYERLVKKFSAAYAFHTSDCVNVIQAYTFSSLKAYFIGLDKTLDAVFFDYENRHFKTLKTLEKFIISLEKEVFDDCDVNLSLIYKYNKLMKKGLEAWMFTQRKDKPKPIFANVTTLGFIHGEPKEMVRYRVNGQNVFQTQDFSVQNWFFGTFEELAKNFDGDTEIEMTADFVEFFNKL